VCYWGWSTEWCSNRSGEVWCLGGLVVDDMHSSGASWPVQWCCVSPLLISRFRSCVLFIVKPMLESFHRKPEEKFRSCVKRSDTNLSGVAKSAESIVVRGDAFRPWAEADPILRCRTFSADFATYEIEEQHSTCNQPLTYILCARVVD